MVSVIYFNFDNQPSFDTLKALSVLASDVTHIGFQTSNLKNLSAEFLVAKDSLGSDILQTNILRAIDSAKYNNVLFLSELDINDASLQDLVDSAKNLKQNECSILGIKNLSEEDLDAKKLVNSISRLGIQSIFSVALSKEFLSQNIYNGYSGFREFIHSQFISAKAFDLNIQFKEFNGKEINQLTNSERAFLLEQVINLFNIEDIYSSFDWKNHSDESAAAAYHTLGAIFIKLQDYRRAEECLNISDQLEESPRSMALRAVIAHGQGQTLQAVAGLVTSLQHYEVRKKDDNNRHYLKFVPKDLESINKRLNKGLSALNHRDNETALFHFADAIYNFDEFYNEQGLKDLIS